MKFFSVLDELLAENRILKLGILGLTVSNVATAFLLFHTLTSQKIVVVPPEIRREFWIAGDRVSRAYLEQVFFFLSDRILSVSPENVDMSLSTIYPFLTTDPSLLPQIEKVLIKYKNHIKENRIWQVFYPMNLTVRGNEVVVSGIIKKAVENQLIGSFDKRIRFKFSVRNSRLVVEGIEL